MATPQNRGRFPGYDTLDQADSWDRNTRRVVEARLAAPGPRRFFTAAEERICRALVDRLLAQDGDPRVPVFEAVDARLQDRQTDGWHHQDMPDDGEAWRRSLAALDELAQARLGKPFGDLGREDQIDLLETVKDGESLGGLPAHHLWNLWLRYALHAFYSHPWAWNEIGFGGPAYPRGYKNLGLGGREGWEVEEVRPRNPEPWAARVDAAKRRHAARLGAPRP